MASSLTVTFSVSMPVAAMACADNEKGERIQRRSLETQPSLSGSHRVELFTCGIRYFCAMASFSSNTYPDTSIISIRSRKGSGIVSNRFAVQMNNTFDRSTEDRMLRDFHQTPSFDMTFEMGLSDLRPSANSPGTSR